MNRTPIPYACLREDLVSVVEGIKIDKERGLRPIIILKNFSPFALDPSHRRNFSAYRFSHLGDRDLWLLESEGDKDFSIPYAKIKSIVFDGVNESSGFSTFTLYYLWDDEK